MCRGLTAPGSVCVKRNNAFIIKQKKSHNKGDWNQYKSFKRDTLKAVRRQRWKYIHDLLQVGLDRGDTKPFWGYVKAQRQDNMGVSPLRMGVHSTLTLSRGQRSWTNSSSPCSRGRAGSTCLTSMGWTTLYNIPDIHVAQEGVEKLLKNLNPKKASAPDYLSLPQRISHRDDLPFVVQLDYSQMIAFVSPHPLQPRSGDPPAGPGGAGAMHGAWNSMRPNVIYIYIYI